MVAKISIPVSNVADLIGLGFTRIEIWRTEEYENEYAEITDSAASAAVLDSLEASTLFKMGGTLLVLKIDGGAEQSISFGSVLDYWTPTQVANRINEVVVGLATVVGNKIRLTSPSTGRSSSIHVVYNDAFQLGLSAGTLVRGKDSRITLSGGTVLYQYTDPVGAAGDKYKWRFSANGVEPISEFSAQVLGSTPPISALNISIAMAYFADMGGRAKKTRVIVSQDSSIFQTSGYVVSTDHTEVFDSDDLGFLQIPLVQGMKVRFAIEGTTFVREITIPNTPTFDLLAALATAPDPFTVKTIPPFLIRRSI